MILMSFGLWHPLAKHISIISEFLQASFNILQTKVIRATKKIYGSSWRLGFHQGADDNHHGLIQTGVRRQSWQTLSAAATHAHQERMSRCAGDDSTDLAHVAHGVVEEHLNSNRHPGLRETTRSKVGLLIIWFMLVPSIIGFYPVFETAASVKIQTSTNSSFPSHVSVWISLISICLNPSSRTAIPISSVSELNPWPHCSHCTWCSWTSGVWPSGYNQK